MAKRKQTTASPEKIPMKTDRTRKKRSSRKTDRSKTPRCRSGSDANGSACPFSSGISGCELGMSKLVSFVQFCDHQQGHIGCARSAARAIGFAFNFENQIHRGFDQVWIFPQTSLGNLRFHLRPIVGEVRLRDCGRKLRTRGRAGLKPLTGCGKSFYDNPVALVDRYLSPERVHLQDQFRSLEASRAPGIAGIGGHSGLKITLRQSVVAQLECCASSPRQGFLIVAIRFQGYAVLGERMLI